MQRERGIINDITGCFPIFWTQCGVCAREFKFEKGWLRFNQYGNPRYYCRKCCATKQDVVNAIR